MNATQKYLLNKKRELSGLNFLREIKETSKKCKSETKPRVNTRVTLSFHMQQCQWFKMMVLQCALRIPEVQRPTGPEDPRGQNSFHNNSKSYFHAQLCSECTQEFSRDRICDIRTLMTSRISHCDCVCLYFYLFKFYFPGVSG